MFRIDANSLSPYFKSVKRFVPKLSNDKISVTLLYHRCHVRDSVTSNYNGNASPYPIRGGLREIDQSDSAYLYTHSLNRRVTCRLLVTKFVSFAFIRPTWLISCASPSYWRNWQILCPDWLSLFPL